MIEIIAVIFSLISVWLTSKNNIWCWPTGIIGIVFYFILFFQGREYCNMLLQLTFLFQSVTGWINWNKKDELGISLYNVDLSIGKYIYLLIQIIQISAIYYIISLIFNGQSILLDSITTGLSIMAMFLLSIKKLESWILWIIADILYIPFFIQSEHYLSAGVYFTFLCLAVAGFINWKKKLYEI
jgi:nicotinamide mononucleotide transporter